MAGTGFLQLTRSYTITPSRWASVELRDGDITGLLRQAGEGCVESRNRLFELILPELRRVASGKLRRERAGISLSTTDLVHETFVRFSGQNTQQQNRTQLVGVFAMLTRWVLIDHWKKKQAEIHGGNWKRVTLHPDLSLPWKQAEKVLAIHECLERLERENPRQGRIVELRFFGGLSNPEIAELLEISLSTVEADWRFARAWLRVELEDSGWR